MSFNHPDLPYLDDAAQDSYEFFQTEDSFISEHPELFSDLPALSHDDASCFPFDSFLDLEPKGSSLDIEHATPQPQQQHPYPYQFGAPSQHQPHRQSPPSFLPPPPRPTQLSPPARPLELKVVGDQQAAAGFQPTKRRKPVDGPTGTSLSKKPKLSTSSSTLPRHYTPPTKHPAAGGPTGTPLPPSPPMSSTSSTLPTIATPTITARGSPSSTTSMPPTTATPMITDREGLFTMNAPPTTLPPPRPSLTAELPIRYDINPESGSTAINGDWEGLVRALGVAIAKRQIYFIDGKCQIDLTVVLKDQPEL